MMSTKLHVDLDNRQKGYRRKIKIDARWNCKERHGLKRGVCAKIKKRNIMINRACVAKERNKCKGYKER